MSRAALCALVLAGCNQVFGLDPTVSLDANLGPDVIEAGSGRVLLTRMQVDVVAPAPGAPELSPLPVTNALIYAVLLSGELIKLEAEPPTLGDNGEPVGPTIYIVPGLVLQQPSRLEITFSDGSPAIDVPWPDMAVDIELVIPEIGHVTGDELNLNETWAVDLGDGPTTFAGSAIIATGAWVSTQGGGDADGVMDVSWSDARFDSDARVRPSEARGDYTVALELATSAACSRLPIGYGAFPAPPLGVTDPDVPAWFTKTEQLQASWDVLVEIASAGIVLGSLAGPDPWVDRFTLGYAPAAQSVTRAWRIGPSTPTRMVGPGILPLVECDAESMGQPFFTPIDELQDRYGETAYGSIRWTRSLAGGPQVDSGFELVAPVSGSGENPRSVVLAREVAFPTAIEVGVDGAFVPLVDDTVSISRTSRIGVKFTPEDESAGEVRVTNFWSITLARVEPTRLVPLRIYLTQATDAVFDLSDASRYPAGGYVFVIRGHLGWSRAAMGNFADFELPYQIATATSHKFTLP